SPPSHNTKHQHPSLTRRPSDLQETPARPARCPYLQGHAEDRVRLRGVVPRKIPSGPQLYHARPESPSGGGAGSGSRPARQAGNTDWKSTRLKYSHLVISYAVLC